MAQRQAVTIPLSGEDRLEIMIERDGGIVKGFVVNYVATIHGREFSVVRYDTRHGHAHKDVLWPDGTHKRKEPMPPLDGRALVDFAIDDMKANWRGYRQRFERWA
jgi:hypothetical protein